MQILLQIFEGLEDVHKVLNDVPTRPLENSDRCQDVRNKDNIGNVEDAEANTQIEVIKDTHTIPQTLETSASEGLANSVSHENEPIPIALVDASIPSLDPLGNESNPVKETVPQLAKECLKIATLEPEIIKGNRKSRRKDNSKRATAKCSLKETVPLKASISERKSARSKKKVCNSIAKPGQSVSIEPTKVSKSSGESHHSPVPCISSSEPELTEGVNVSKDDSRNDIKELLEPLEIPSPLTSCRSVPQLSSETSEEDTSKRVINAAEMSIRITVVKLLMDIERSDEISPSMHNYFIQSFITNYTATKVPPKMSEFLVTIFFQVDFIDIFYPHFKALDRYHSFYRKMIKYFPALRFLVYTFPVEMYEVMIQNKAVIQSASDKILLHIVMKTLATRFLKYLEATKLQMTCPRLPFFLQCPRRQYLLFAKDFMLGQTQFVLKSGDPQFEATFKLPKRSFSVVSCNPTTFCQFEIANALKAYTADFPLYEPFKECGLTLTDLYPCLMDMIAIIPIDFPEFVHLVYCHPDLKPNTNADIFNTYFGFLQASYDLFSFLTLQERVLNSVGGSLDKLFLLYLNHKCVPTPYRRELVKKLSHFNRLKAWIPKSDKCLKSLLHSNAGIENDDMFSVYDFTFIKLLRLNEILMNSPNITRVQFLLQYRNIDSQVFYDI